MGESIRIGCDAQRAQKEWREHVARDGLWILVTSWRASEDDPWESTDSCGGFVGDEWRDSGYDTDLKLAALDALAEEQERRTAAAADCLAERATLAGVMP